MAFGFTAGSRLSIFAGVRVDPTLPVADPARRVGVTSSSSGVAVDLVLTIVVGELDRRVGVAAASSGIADAFALGVAVTERRGPDARLDAPSTIPERGLIRGSEGAGIGA